MLPMAANRLRSMAIITGRLGRNSIHGPSGTASIAPAAVPTAASADTSAGPACSTTRAISGNAPNAKQVPNELTAYAAHRHSNCRPSDCLPSMPATPPSSVRPGPCRSKRKPAGGGQQPRDRRVTTGCCALGSAAMDTVAVRTFVAVAEAGQFSAAAADLGVSQQAVSKRVAALEKDLGVALFARTPRGADLTGDGQAFLPHARDLLRAADRAAAAVRPGERALRVDVISRRIAPARLLADFPRAPPGPPLEVVRLFDARAALEAVRDGSVDASFRAVTQAARNLPAGLATVRVLDEPVQLLTGPAHPLADRAWLSPAQLAGLPIWMPALDPGTEWTAFYAELGAAFGLSLDVTGPDFGTRPLLDVLAGRLGPAPDPAARSGSGLPALADLAPGQSAPHPAGAAHAPGGRPPGPGGLRSLGPGLGPAA